MCVEKNCKNINTQKNNCSILSNSYITIYNKCSCSYIHDLQANSKQCEAWSLVIKMKYIKIIMRF